MKTISIIADSNIPHIQDALSNHNTTLCMYNDGSDLTSLLQNADCLLCRSTIKVNEELLRGSSVKFVATATSGSDHFDIEYLHKNGIRWNASPGSNAQSVAEYVFNALYSISESKGVPFRNKTLGVVGVGNVGSRVADVAKRLGMRTLLCDPPLCDETGDKRYLSFRQVLEEADILTFHTPLTSTGKHPTLNMVNRDTIACMKQGAIFINVARGGVVNEQHLKEAIVSSHFSAVVLDVFEHEPAVDSEMVSMVDIATPHIAGHSYDGKLLGTQMVYDALCSFLGWEKKWEFASHLPTAQQMKISLDSVDESGGVNHVFRHVYDILYDDAALRKIVAGPADNIASAFKRYRSNYRIRREANAYKVLLPEKLEGNRTEFEALGFQVSIVNC